MNACGQTLAFFKTVRHPLKWVKFCSGTNYQLQTNTELPGTNLTLSCIAVLANKSRIMVLANSPVSCSSCLVYCDIWITTRTTHTLEIHPHIVITAGWLTAGRLLFSHSVHDLYCSEELKAAAQDGCYQGAKYHLCAQRAATAQWANSRGCICLQYMRLLYTANSVGKRRNERTETETDWNLRAMLAASRNSEKANEPGKRWPLITTHTDII